VLVLRHHGSTFNKQGNKQMNNDSVIFTKKELWLNQAGCFGFQFNEDQLLKKALKAGFVTKVGEDQYLMNDEYQSRNA
jgi:hypothetical protein